MTAVPKGEQTAAERVALTDDETAAQLVFARVGWMEALKE